MQTTPDSGAQSLETLPLGRSKRTTTRLGFGCSSVMGLLGRRESLAMLESAYDAGIRHFDVAPMYGYGEAEGCLGEVLARHRRQVTTTAKNGIPAKPSRPMVRLARSIARPVLQRFPGLKQRVRGLAASTAAPSQEKAAF